MTDKDSDCRFVLLGVDENIIRSEIGFDVFEPKVSLEINGKNVFEPLGISGVENPVIMHSLERFLQETLRLLETLKVKSTSEHRYWFLGTGFGVKLRREGTSVALFLEVDGHWGPVQGLAYPQSVEVGILTVREWVKSIVSFARTLLDFFKRLNPGIYSSMKEQELQIQQLNAWLGS